MRILFCCNTLHGFCNFRLDVVEHLVRKGNEAVIVYPYKEDDELILQTLPEGSRAIPCKMSPNGKSLTQDTGYFLRLLKILRKERPDLVINYTVKPNIFGGIAAKISGVPSVAMAPGLGYVFTKKGALGWFLRKIYIYGLRFAEFVLTLNSSDQEQLVANGLKKERIILLKGGEGVNLKRFPYSEGVYEKPRFLMISRLLYDKGYREFVNAASKIKAIYPDTRFEIAGTLNEQNPAGVPHCILFEDERAGRIKYIGYVEKIVKELADTVVVLPSYYREGMNRSLMEACSCGRPIITTCLPGLKELVIDGVNGFLVEPKSTDSLLNGINSFMKLPLEKRVEMGRISRELAEKRFSVQNVMIVYDRIIEQIFSRNV